MMVDLLERPAKAGDSDRASQGGVPARRAMVRWAWRLFRREWRQQLLILALVIVAVAATVVGATVATNAPAPAGAGFGTAGYMSTLQGSGPQLRADLVRLEGLVGPVDAIENETLAVPGSINTYDLRAQNPHGAFGQPMLSLVSGHYPTEPDQVALTSGLASELKLKVGDVWHQGGTSRTVVGMVQNPQSLLDEFALVVPGQVATPTQITALFDASPSKAHGHVVGLNIVSRASATPGNAFNPETIVLALATLGMLLVGLVAVGGFTVLAQRRLRSIGMLGSLGATDRHIRLVMRANGVVVGVVGALLGAALGLAAWLAYRPHAEASSHHLIGMFAVPWVVVIITVALAIVATYFAASRPARAVTRISIVTALSGRPPPPQQVHRSAVPGVIAIVIAFFLLGAAASTNGNGGGAPELVFGLVSLIVAIIFLAPLTLTPLARFTRRGPVALRLAVRDLARYRARSGSALAAITLGVLIAVIICVLAASRYGNVLDYAGPNMTSNQLVVYAPSRGPSQCISPSGSCGPQAPPVSLATASAKAHEIATGLGAGAVVQLDQTSATLQHDAAGRQFGGQVFVASPQLLRAFGISGSRINPKADFLTMRPGLSSLSLMQATFGNGDGGGGGGKGGPVQLGGPTPSGPNTLPCPASSCVANPVIQEVSALPSGTSTPNTVVTEHFIHQHHLPVSTVGWLIRTAQPLTGQQISNAQAIASSASGMSIETKNDQPTSSEIINWATVFGIVLALGVLAMSVGLIRSESASDLRILTASGAGSRTRRALTASTAGVLGLLGAVIGTVAGYVATIAYSRGSANDGLSSLANVPAKNLLIILIGMPLVAAIGGWIFSGRQPSGIATQPTD
jgi:putative ABC transport system permease protein